MGYTPRTGKIYVKTLTSAWQHVLTREQSKAIKGFKIKSRYSGTGAPGPFDIAFTGVDSVSGKDYGTPSTGNDSDGNGYWTNTGAGLGDTAANSLGIWAKSTTDGTVIEIMTYG